MQKGQIVKIISVFLFISFSCSSQQEIISQDFFYEVLEHHYIKSRKTPGNGFLYNKTIDIRNNASFNYIKQKSLSNYLIENFVRKECDIIESIFNKNQLQKMDKNFLKSESVTLEQNKFSKPILNSKYLQKETYVDIPNEASVRITTPILIRSDKDMYVIFAEDAHNEGGTVFIYKLENDKWSLICSSNLWVV